MSRFIRPSHFAFPYFSRNTSEFWRRWHISLTSWLKDYLYIPLGGNRTGKWTKIRNTFIIFLVSGLWHGANWTFIAWGFLNALYILPSIIFNSKKSSPDIVAKGKCLPTAKEFLNIGFTFLLILFAWIFFRAENLSHAFRFILEIFSFSLFTIPNFPGLGKAISILFLTGIFMVIEWIGRDQQYAIALLGSKWCKPARWAVYYVIIICIFSLGGKDQKFIYFQF